MKFPDNETVTLLRLNLNYNIQTELAWCELAEFRDSGTAASAHRVDGQQAMLRLARKIFERSSPSNSRIAQDFRKTVLGLMRLSRQCAAKYVRS
jgi:hypothetical protein